jgi:hypothetical protein
METEKKTSFVVYFIFVLSIFSTAFLAYTSFMSWKNTYQISKAKFICTKIEQIGKNLDDVVCVQYTNQKFSKEAVALNSMMAK